MKTSDLFVKCLEEENIELIFGVPGEENADFMLSLEESDQIRFVLTRHEQGAAFMAEVYGRLTGNPAGCLGTLGPGATNLITGVADANMDRAPMLVLTGQGDTERLHKESHQVMDVVKMFEPVTKWTHSVRHPDNLPEIIRKAVRLARTEKPGACHIELPEDIAKLSSSASPISVRRFRRPVPQEKLIDRTIDLLNNARRPIIIAGNGCIRKRASKQLRLFTKATGIGVISTFMAKGAVDKDDPTCLFTIGLQAKDHVAHLIDAADLVIVLGYDMVEYPPQLWNNQKERPVVHIDFLPAEIDADYHPEVEIVGDIAHTLWMLNERVAQKPLPDYDFTLQASVRESMLEDFQTHANDETTGSIRPQKAIWDARQALGPEDILLSDVGAHKMWIARYYHCHEPNTCLIPNGFCSMGFALPGAIAAHLVHPDKRILAITGDGGFLMNVQEMETAKRLNANIVVMVWEDGGYGLISWKQETEFGRHTRLSFNNPNWTSLSESFGWNPFSCQNAADLSEALEQAFNTPGPSLLTIPIDYTENKKLTQRLGNITRAI